MMGSIQNLEKSNSLTLKKIQIHEVLKIII